MNRTGGSEESRAKREGNPAGPPSGTITFLFTDIEGSAKLWEEDPAAMRLTLVRHDLLMRAAIEDHTGYVFKTMGDAFCAAFHTAPDALRAAVQAQIDLQNENWHVNPIRVRMGIHTGIAELRDDDYFGTVLNRASRIQGIGHGGQALLSQATYELVKDSLPPEVRLIDLGSHRLKDLAAPERVWQVQFPFHKDPFPPLKSLDNLPTNLPLSLTSFIGRESEIAEIKDAFSKSRLLTLTGSGGTGKTRLALQVAAEKLEAYADGIWFVELAPILDPELVTQTVASTLGVWEVPGEPVIRTLLHWLKNKQMVILLDNCEHVLEGSAVFVDALLRDCPGVKVLATSREALGIGGESSYRVPSLSVPDLNVGQTPESLTNCESARLFIERASAVKSDFEVSPASASALASLCCRLDGIPLAVELAAARVIAMSVEQIESRLDARFGLLKGGSRTAQPRHQTLRALVDWSYDLLNEQEKTLLRCLSVFQGGWQLESAEAVAAVDSIEPGDVLDLLSSLVSKCLVRFEESRGEARYHLLETVRQYARDRLIESGRLDLVRSFHRDHFLELSEKAEQKLVGPEQAKWFRRLDDEHENLRAALSWSLCGGGCTEGLRMCESLWCLWETRGLLSEGREWCTRFLDADRANQPSAERAYALETAAWLATLQGDYAVARSYNEESLAIYTEKGDRAGVANALNYLGTVCRYQGDYASARAHYEASVAIDRETHDWYTLAVRLDNLGTMLICQGEYESARGHLEESLAICRSRGDRYNAAYALDNLGSLARHSGDFETSRANHLEALAVRKEFGDRRNASHVLCNLGLLAMAVGDYPAAREYLEESIPIFKEVGERVSLARVLESFASLAAREGQLERCAGLWGAAERVREEIGSPLPPNLRDEYDREVAAARDALGEAAFSTAWSKGRSLPMDESISLALKG